MSRWTKKSKIANFGRTASGVPGGCRFSIADHFPESVARKLPAIPELGFYFPLEPAIYEERVSVDQKFAKSTKTRSRDN